MAFEGLSEKLSVVFKKLKSKGKLTESDIKIAMREVRLALLEADVSYKVVKTFVQGVSQRAVGEEVLESLTPAQQVIKIVNDELCVLMGEKNARIRFPVKPPCVVMMCGLQGSGKTTHCAKIAQYFKQKGHRPLLVACDVYRPAAIDQLKVVGSKAGVPVFELGQIDPVEIATKAVAHAKDHGNDLVLLDTAGRLHIDTVLMNELDLMKERIAPDEVLLVVDAMTGQDAVHVAEQFNQTLSIDGVVLTKLDGDSRGGAALSVLAVTGKPVKFAGIGEKIGDLEPFHPERMASRILGMGDVLTLIEKANQSLSEKQSAQMMTRMKENHFNMNDFLESMNQLKKMGSITQILNMIPGISGKIKAEDIDERQLIRTEALITSMTPQERETPKIINPSRKKRIASGSGMKIEDVNRLLKQMEQMQKMMKQLNPKGNKKRRKRMPFLPPGGMPMA